MRLRTCLAGLVLAFSCVFGHTETVDKLPPPTGYVNDFAGVIDAASKEQMEQICGELDHEAHAQIAIVTVHTLEGDTASDFAGRLEEKWHVGPKATDRGLIMLFAIDDHKRWIEVGYGLEGILNDAKVGDIGRSMVPALRAGEYGPGILGGLQQIAQVIAADANITLSDAQPQPVYREPPVYHRSRGASIVPIIVFLFVLLAIFSGRGFGGGGWLWFLLGSMMGGGGGSDDRGGGFGGGGFGGGDGGGFGGFGGGSSGGGGAGGDW